MKEHFKSKKFTAFFIAVMLTLIFTSVGLISIALIPTASVFIVDLVTVALASMNGAVSMYTIGQSVVDYKIQINRDNP